ncbi:MAG: porin, partial [Candidatus Riflemargulisbacteria bacterium]
MSSVLKLVIIMICSLTLGTSFKDVPSGHWAKESIDRVNSENILTVYKDNTFRGKNYIDRYEMSSIICKILDFQETHGRTPTKQEIKQLTDDDTEMHVAYKKGVFTAYSDDESTKYWLDGRIFLDYGKGFSGKNKIPSGFEARKIRLSFKTIMYKDWAGELDIKFTPNNDPAKNNDLKMEDFWISRKLGENLLLKLGNHKQPASIEEMTTSRYTMFMERSLPVDMFFLSRHAGISLKGYEENVNTILNKYLPLSSWYYMVGIYGDELGWGSVEGYDASTMYAGKGALVFRMDDAILMTAFSAYSSTIPGADISPIDGGVVQLKSSAEAHFHNVSLLDTGSALNHVNSRFVNSKELVFQKGPFMFQTEVIDANYFRESGYQDAYFSGYYAWVAYILTGEKHAWSAEKA